MMGGCPGLCDFTFRPAQSALQSHLGWNQHEATGSHEVSPVALALNYSVAHQWARTCWGMMGQQKV